MIRHRVKRTSQPQTPVPIYYGNPLSRGLVLLNYSNNIILDGAGTITKNNTAAKSVSAHGVSPAYNGSNVDMRIDKSVLGTNPQEATLFAVVKIKQTSVENSIIGCCSSSSANPLFRLEQRPNGDAASGFTLQFRGDNFSFANIGNNVNLISGETAVLFGVFRSGTGVKELYKNGVLVASSTIDVGTITLNRTDIGVLTRITPIQWFNGNIPISGIFNRALSKKEITTLSNNPCQLFAPRPRKLWVVPEAGTPSATGSLSATETANDSIAALATVEIIGTTSATESTSDIASTSGIVGISGSASAVEIGTDSAILDADVTVNGIVAATETGSDGFAVTGEVDISAALSGTESGGDTATIAAGVSVSGGMSVSEIGDDSANLGGVATVSSGFSATETVSDSAETNGRVDVTATVSTTESGTDSFVAGGNVTAPGAAANFAATESALDSANASGHVDVYASVGSVEVGSDTATTSASVAVHGLVNAIESGNDEFAADVTTVAAITGTLNTTETGSDTADSVATVTVSASVAAIETGSDVFAATETDTVQMPGWLEALLTLRPALDARMQIQEVLSADLEINGA